MDENLALANKIVSELKKLEEFISKKESDIEKSNLLTPEKRLYKYLIHLENNMFEIECNEIECVPHDDCDSRHLLCLIDFEVVAEFWDVCAWIKCLT